MTQILLMIALINLVPAIVFTVYTRKIYDYEDGVLAKWMEHNNPMSLYYYRHRLYLFVGSYFCWPYYAFLWVRGYSNRKQNNVTLKNGNQ